MTEQKRIMTAEEEKFEAQRLERLAEKGESVELDHELEDTFPASDPPSIMRREHHPGGPIRKDEK